MVPPVTCYSGLPEDFAGMVSTYNLALALSLCSLAEISGSIPFGPGPARLGSHRDHGRWAPDLAASTPGRGNAKGTGSVCTNQKRVRLCLTLMLGLGEKRSPMETNHFGVSDSEKQTLQNK